jgi:hypothetical protein
MQADARSCPVRGAFSVGPEKTFAVDAGKPGAVDDTPVGDDQHF